MQDSRFPLEVVDGVPVVQVSPPGYTGTQHAIKRIFDVVVATLILLTVAVPMLVLACLVCLTSPGPAMFRQQRIGQHGKPFTLFKLRSMRLDAEAELAKVLGGVRTAALQLSRSGGAAAAGRACGRPPRPGAAVGAGGPAHGGGNRGWLSGCLHRKRPQCRRHPWRASVRSRGPPRARTPAS